ncbi:MAG: hypothetical protein SAK42_17730, partial [Oscillatoria sp. PMC 1076.18]|nr:hypothetical protein [Oscillatoria sp. PMC 1076.18]
MSVGDRHNFRRTKSSLHKIAKKSSTFHKKLLVGRNLVEFELVKAIATIFGEPKVRFTKLP